MVIRKEIKWYENKYLISNTWLVKSLNYQNSWKSKLLNPYINKYWYAIVGLCNNKTHKKFKVHRLVAMTYISNIDNKPQVNHKNWIKYDNRADNLEWCTPSYNMKHSYDKLNRYRHWNWNPSHLYKKIKQYWKSGNLIKIWNSQVEIEKTLWIKQYSISHCLIWRQKTAWWFKWKYY